jgi:hypothetical protein
MSGHTASIQLGEKRPRRVFDPSALPNDFWKIEPTEDESVKRQVVSWDEPKSCRELMNSRQAPPTASVVASCMDYDETTKKEDLVMF